MPFETIYKQLNFHNHPQLISHANGRPQVSQIKGKIRNILDDRQKGLSFEDLTLLLSPAADICLDEIIERAQWVTRQRFGNVIQFYAPLYLSNHCHSTCTYCGFSRVNQIDRLTLTVEETIAEAQIIAESGIQHILLLTGEDYKETPLPYLKEVVQEFSSLFASVSIEVYPLETNDYQELRSVGLDGVAIYQETYDQKRYQQVHLGGMKKRLHYRLDCPDRICQAGIRRLSIGALLGLSDPAQEVYFLAVHARYLIQQYWRTELSISLPRLRPAVGLDDVPLISNRDYVRYLCALRLFLPESGLNLSTRESPDIRDWLTDICITHISAASKTEPGGYSGKKSTEQFQTDDKRSVREMKEAIMKNGLEPVFIDWNSILK